VKKVAVIGCGLQAARRIAAIRDDKSCELVAAIDRDEAKARRLVGSTGARVATDWREVVRSGDLDVVLVLTYPDSHAEISIEAMRAGCDVLCEKPLARTVDEAREMRNVARQTARILKCGFNHRHHPAVLEAQKRLSAGEIGKPIFGRGRYGIGGRLGIEKEWRSNPDIVPGGQLMEQGIHLVDLFRWFAGDVAEVTGMMSTVRWPIAPLEDNGFLLARTRHGATFSIHASTTQWTNLFELEIYGESGSLTVHGLGASYGVEKLIASNHDPSAPFSHHTIEYRGGDVSWANEWAEFMRCVRERSEPLGGGEDGVRAMEIVAAAYEASRTGRTVKLVA
jgi:predicted dehydrogenase